MGGATVALACDANTWNLKKEDPEFQASLNSAMRKQEKKKEEGRETEREDKREGIHIMCRHTRICMFCMHLLTVMFVLTLKAIQVSIRMKPVKCSTLGPYHIINTTLPIKFMC